MLDIEWDTATWLNEPPDVRVDGRDLVVTTSAKTDFWRTTNYGYITDNGHALLAPAPLGNHMAVHVTFEADSKNLYDQAGVLVRVDAEHWLKAGVEMAGGLLVGAVMTNGVSDWSQAPVPEWADRSVTIKVHRVDDSLIVWAGAGDEDLRQIRLAPLAPDAVAMAGPYCCSPTGGGMRVRFTRFAMEWSQWGKHPQE
ncbi:MAG TPA: DUF1349 domain-containing protein [Pseudonocardiaceae bacterium]|nr:DUF1349 domain-containing protein [Pseudonocardiaceae bacterium]